MLAGRFLLITLRFTSIIIEIPASHNENQTFQYVVINLSSCRQCALQRFSGPRVDVVSGDIVSRNICKLL